MGCIVERLDERLAARHNTVLSVLSSELTASYAKAVPKVVSLFAGWQSELLITPIINEQARRDITSIGNNSMVTNPSHHLILAEYTMSQ
jgi:hypothetical protein